MKYDLLILMATLLFGCGRHPGIQTGFETEMANFRIEGRARGLDYLDVSYINITLVNDFDYDDTIGECEWTNGSVTILRSYWEDANSAEREMLVFHELGHCVLEKGHTKEIEIMNAYDVISPYNYTQNRMHYLNVLFKS